jgi:sugar O-acyltransferase (sialic acid O-acetyltransferase NeuD family)
MAASAGFEYEVVGFFDDNAGTRSQIGGIPVRGGIDALRLCKGLSGVFIAIGNPLARRTVTQKILALDQDTVFPNIIHPSSTVDLLSLAMGSGNYIAAGARLTANVRIGNFNIINLNSVLGHDVVLGDRCHIGPGAILSGQVVVHDEVLIGAGAVLMPRIEVGRGATVGIGAVVGYTVMAGHTVLGNPARIVRSVTATRT